MFARRYCAPSQRRVATDRRPVRRRRAEFRDVQTQVDRHLGADAGAEPAPARHDVGVGGVRQLAQRRERARRDGDAVVTDGHVLRHLDPVEQVRQLVQEAAYVHDVVQADTQLRINAR